MLTHALYGSPVPRRAHGFEQNSLNGILLHFLARWNAVILENMTNYVRGVQTFRRTCNPNLEMSKWIQEGMAEVISPWMHFIGTRQEDRRQFENGRPLLDWHSKNEDTLYHRPRCERGPGVEPAQRQFLRLGREPHPLRRALAGLHLRADPRIPALSLHADYITRYAPGIAVLILPKLAAMSDGQIWMVEDFVWCGGSVVYTGVTGMLDEWSEARSCFPLDELFGTAAATWPPLCVSSGALARVVSSTPCTPTCASRSRTTRSCAGLRMRTSCSLAGSSTRSPPTGLRRWRPSSPPS